MRAACELNLLQCKGPENFARAVYAALCFARVLELLLRDKVNVRMVLYVLVWKMEFMD